MPFLPSEGTRRYEKLAKTVTMFTEGVAYMFYQSRSDMGRPF